MHETPHTKEHADLGEHRGDHVLFIVAVYPGGLVRSPETLPGAAVQPPLSFKRSRAQARLPDFVRVCSEVSQVGPAV